MPLLPHSYEDTEVGGFDIGDTKEFTDGSTRQLDYAPSGVRRWLGTGKDENQQPDQNNIKPPSNIDAIGVVRQDIERITKPEWMQYNQFLTPDNPFVRASSLDEMAKIWFGIAYELHNRWLVYKDIIERNPDNGYLYQERIQKIKQSYVTLDNYFLAFEMYKINVVIARIQEFEPQFDYEGFVAQGNNWQALNDYCEKLYSQEEEQASINPIQTQQ